jgi:hypothetical protein
VARYWFLPWQEENREIVTKTCRKILKGKETCRLYSTIIQKIYRGGESLNNSQKQGMASADQHKLLLYACGVFQ